MAFGSSAFGQPASASTFGQAIPSSNTLWPASSAAPSSSTVPPQGTRAAKWQVSHLQDASSSASDPAKFLTISAMPLFRPFSVEELRLADYSRGDRGGDAPAQSNPFAAPTAAPSLFGPQSSATAPTAFGNPAPNTAPSLFGAAPAAQSSSLISAAPAAQSSSLFGAPSRPAPSLFGAPAQPATAASLFGAPAPAATGTSLFGAPAQQPATAASLFGAPAPSTTAASLFGAPAPAPTGTSLFGAPAQQPATAASLFGAPAPATAASLFGAPANTGATSLFGASANTGATSLFGAMASTGASLFGAPANTGASLFGAPANTGTSLFGAPANTGASLFGAPSTGASLFGAQPQQQQQQPQGPLEASLTSNPFGDSKLFAGLSATAPPTTSGTAATASVITMPLGPGQSHPNSVSVVVKSSAQPYRRTRTSELLARQAVMQRSSQGSGWFAASPMRPWSEEGSVFNVGSVLRPRMDRTGGFGKPRSAAHDVTPWRTDEQRTKAANLKQLVIEPIPENPVMNRGRQQAPRPMSEQIGGVSRSQVASDMVTPSLKTREAIGRPDNPFRAFEALPDRTPPSKGISVPTQAMDRPAAEEEIDVREADATQDNRNQDLIHDDTQGPSPTADDGRPASEHEDAGQTPGRFVPYSEFYKNQMSGGRGKSSIGSESTRRGSRRGSFDMPKCSDSDYYMIPSLDEISKMSNEEMSKVKELTIGKKGMGEILWLEPVDVRGLDVDRAVQIKNREVSVYPHDEDVPPVGEGLNKPARIKLYGIHKFDKRTKEPLTDATTAAKMVSKLKSHCLMEGLDFLGYDVKTGTWTFKSNNF